VLAGDLIAMEFVRIPLGHPSDAVIQLV